jgi:hypothetical protein
VFAAEEIHGDDTTCGAGGAWTHLSMGSTPSASAFQRIEAV